MTTGTHSRVCALYMITTLYHKMSATDEEILDAAYAYVDDRTRMQIWKTQAGELVSDFETLEAKLKDPRFLDPFWMWTKVRDERCKTHEDRLELVYKFNECRQSLHHILSKVDEEDERVKRFVERDACDAYPLDGDEKLMAVRFAVANSKYNTYATRRNKEFQAIRYHNEQMNLRHFRACQAFADTCADTAFYTKRLGSVWRAIYPEIQAFEIDLADEVYEVREVERYIQAHGFESLASNPGAAIVLNFYDKCVRRVTLCSYILYSGSLKAILERSMDGIYVDANDKKIVRYLADCRYTVGITLQKYREYVNQLRPFVVAASVGVTMEERNRAVFEQRVEEEQRRDREAEEQDRQPSATPSHSQYSQSTTRLAPPFFNRGKMRSSLETDEVITNVPNITVETTEDGGEDYVISRNDIEESMRLLDIKSQPDPVEFVRLNAANKKIKTLQRRFHPDKNVDEDAKRLNEAFGKVTVLGKALNANSQMVGGVDGGRWLTTNEYV